MTTVPTPASIGPLEVLVGLRVAVQVDARRVDARGDRVDELAGAGDVAAQALLGHRAQARGAGEGLGGEDGQGVVPPRGQLVAVLARPGAQRPLVDHVGRRAELGGEVAQPAAADDEVAAVVDARRRAGRGRRGRSSAQFTMRPWPRCFASRPSPSPRSRGCGPSQADALELVESGPVGDRAFHVREADGEIALTMRNPRLVQVVPTWNAPERRAGTGVPRRPARRGAGRARRRGLDRVLRRARRARAASSRDPSPPPCPSTSGATVQLVADDEGVVGGDDHPVTLMSDGSLAAVVAGPRRSRRRPAPLPHDDLGRGRRGVGGGRLGGPRGRHRHGDPARRRPHRALRGDDARPRRRPWRPADPARPRAACAASATSPSACGATSLRPAPCAWATRWRPPSRRAGGPPARPPRPARRAGSPARCGRAASPCRARRSRRARRAAARRSRR